jgi:YesN/AraC family two-component response regulator
MTMSAGPTQNKEAKLSVLIADDAEATRRSARLMMTLLPSLRVVAVGENGRQAVELAEKHQPDIVLMDINMPEMDGLTALQVMLRHRPETACVIMSAERDSETLRAAMTSGARGYLIKPFTTDQLIEVMDRVIKLIWRDRKRLVQTAELRQQRDDFLKELAREYVKNRRTDDRARDVLEQLAANPECESRWLVSLATVYLIRREWGRLKELAGRMEQRAQQK